MCSLIKTWPSICFKTRGQAFETVSRAFETLGREFEALRDTQSSAESLKCLVENWKSSAECLKRSGAFLCYNTARAVPISHGKFLARANDLNSSS